MSHLTIKTPEGGNIFLNLNSDPPRLSGDVSSAKWVTNNGGEIRYYETMNKSWGQPRRPSAGDLIRPRKRQ